MLAAERAARRPHACHFVSEFCVKKPLGQYSRILVTGGGGLVGAALIKTLRSSVDAEIFAPSRVEVDWTDRQAARACFQQYRPDLVFHLAAKVYGIMGNMDNMGPSFLDNTLINAHVIDAAREVKARKVVAMGTGCIYPYPPVRLPLSEDQIWHGPPHPSELAYAHSKRAMLAQLEAYKISYNLISAFVISANLFGPNDKFDIAHGHVVPSLVRKFYEAKVSGTAVSVWGDGSARRDFMYATDVASALVAIAEQIEGPVNMASGQIHSIRDIVDTLVEITGHDRIVWDATKPNGQDYRAYDCTKLEATGFKAVYSLRAGLEETWNWYCANQGQIRV